MTDSENRRKILEEVREALLTGEIAPIGGRQKPETSESLPSAENIEALTGKFVEEAVLVGGLVHRAADAEEARNHLKGIIEKCEAKLVVRWDDPLLAELGLDDVMKKAGVEVITENLRILADAEEGGYAPPEKIEEARAFVKQKLAQADLGITGAQYAIAETGTLVLSAGEGRGRAVSALPPVHVAVVKTENLVSSMGELLPLASGSQGRDIPTMESCLYFITGPSRTGDIELELTIGVHGPRELHIILLGAE